MTLVAIDAANYLKKSGLKDALLSKVLFIPPKEHFLIILFRVTDLRYYHDYVGKNSN